MAETAQDTFKRMIREEVAPALRALGFKGSGQSYTLPSDTHWALLGFQRSKWSNSTKVEFIMNLSVVSKAVWDEARVEFPYYPERPAANERYGRFDDERFWYERIGRGEEWWSLLPGSTTTALSGEVVAAVRDIGLPTMQEQIRAADSQSRG